MNYFQPYAPPLDDAIVAAWDSQIAEAAETPLLAQALAQSAEIFPRFAACYARLRALPRGARRALQRQLARSGELTAVPPEWRRKLAASLAGAALLLALAQGAQAAKTKVKTISVTTNNPAVIPGDKKCSLIEAIQNANDHAQTNVDCAAGVNGPNTITLSKNSTHTLTSAYYYGYSGLPDITSQITISGTGARIVGSGGFRLITVSYYGNLTLKDLTLSGGSTYYGGGGAVANYGSLTIDKTTITGNTAYGNGGGIFNLGSLTITNGSTVSNNSSYERGGGVFNDAYAALTVTNSTISGNSSIDGHGGGVFNSSSATLNVTNTTISGNTAGDINHNGFGGGVFNDYYAALTITNSTISGNTAQGYGSYGGQGGGVFTRSASLTITNGTISGNTAKGTPTIIYNDPVYGPTTTPGYGGRGGGVFSGTDDNGDKGSITISNSTITGNLAESLSADAPSFGGGVYTSSALFYNYLTLNRSLISGNSATNGAEIANFQAISVDIYTAVYDPNPPYGIISGTTTTTNVVTANNFNLFGNYNDPGIYNYTGITPLTPGLTDVVPSATLSAILGTLKANGGLTQTHALVAKTSPALKKVPKAGCPATDQRGTKRPQPTKDTFCDIGSFEQK